MEDTPVNWTAVAAVSAALALIFGIISSCFSRKIARISVQLQYYTPLRSWADDVVGLLSKAEFLSICAPPKMPAPPNDFFTKRGEMMAELSALIDRGRWFLPNDAPDKFGQNKPRAYRGFRQEALSLLVEAREILGALNTQTGAQNAARREPLVEIKRKFVSEIQEVLDPRKTEDELLKSRTLFGRRPQSPNR